MGLRFWLETLHPGSWLPKEGRSRQDPEILVSETRALGTPDSWWPQAQGSAQACCMALMSPFSPLGLQCLTAIMVKAEEGER